MEGRGNMLEAKPLFTNGRKFKVLRNGCWQVMYRPVNPDRSFSGTCLAESFAKAYSDEHPEVEVGIIPCADGGIALLAWGVLGLLKAFGIFDKFPDRLGNIESKKIAEFGIFGLAGLNVLLLVFLIIFSATNSESYSEYGMEGSAGIFISLVITVGAAVALKILEKKLPARKLLCVAAFTRSAQFSENA